MSLLLAQGHQDARHYPLGMVWEEVEIVVERLNQDAASNAVLMNAAGIGVMSKKGAQAFRKLIKGLTGG